MLNSIPFQRTPLTPGGTLAEHPGLPKTYQKTGSCSRIGSFLTNFVQSPLPIHPATKILTDSSFNQSKFLMGEFRQLQVKMKRQYKIVATYEHNKEAYRLWSKKDLEDLKSWCEKAIDKMSDI